MLHCPECGTKAEVIDSRVNHLSFVRRRRRCTNEKCGHRYTTFEVPAEFMTVEIEEVEYVEQ
jgi:transcriptional regulator NrdR family protein